MSKQYDKYKDSGIDWLGGIPSHWKMAKIKHIATIVNGSTPDSSADAFWDGDIVWVTPADLGKLEGRYINDSARKITELGLNSCGTSLVPEGSVILTTRAPIGNIGIANVEACTNQGCKSLILHEGDSRYLYYQLLTFRQHIESLGAGSTFKELSTTSLKEFAVPSPESDEQAAIADYLDHKTRQIDKLIAQKEQLMDLLKRKRQAIINEAVTQGLDPNAPRKDSGIEWLGEIPAHWEVWKVARAFSTIGSGTTPQSGVDKYYENGTVNWVNTGDLNDGTLLSCEKKVTEKALEEYSTLKIYPPGTILIAMYGATIGKTSLLGIEACTNQACCALNDSSVINSKYAFYWFLAHKEMIVSLAYGGGQPNISQSTIRNLKICRPPEMEQEEIVRFLDQSVLKISKTLSQIENQLQKLKYYRLSVISEVVTGKVDVRNVVLDVAV